MADDKYNADTEKTETDNAKTHNGAAAECYFKSGRHTAFACGIGGTNVCISSSLHADKAGKDREGCAKYESNGGTPTNEETYNNEENSHKNGYHFIFAAKKSHGTDANIAGDFFHPVVAFVLFCNPCLKNKGHNKGDDTYNRNSVEQILHNACFTPVREKCFGQKPML